MRPSRCKPEPADNFRFVVLGYGSPWAVAQLPSRRKRSAFYTRVGRLLPPGPAGQVRLARLGAAPEPRDVLARLGA